MSPDKNSSAQINDSGPRRVLHGVQYITSDPIASIENWLDMHCRGKWTIAIEDMDVGQAKKTLKILFEEPGDKQNFIANFAKKRR